MPAAKTERPTSTKSPTRSSVQVNCLRCAILSFLPFLLQRNYGKIKRETVSDIHLSFRQVLPARPQNKRRLRVRPESAWRQFWRLPPHFRWRCCERRASSQRRNGSLPE